MVIRTRAPELSSMTVYVKVLEGRDLIAKDRNMMGKRTTSDPYAHVYAGAKKLGQTKVVMKTLAPKWNEDFKLELGSDDANAVLGVQAVPVILSIIVYDYDAMSSDDSMGVAEMTVDPFQTEAKSTWLDVKSGKPESPYYCKKAKGQICLQVRCEAHSMQNVQRGDSKVIQYSRLRVGLAWDVIPPKHVGGRKQAVDLDCSCVAVSPYGQVLMDETVYYGNLSNSNNSIHHSGDETTGESTGDDEKIFLELDRIPPKVRALYFILTVATPDFTFKHVKSAKVRFISTETRHGICQYQPEQFGDNTALFLVRIARSSKVQSQWILTPIEEGDACARDFGSLIPQIKSYTRDLIPSIQVDPNERIAIMRKGGTIRVSDYTPNRKIPKNVVFGLAWDITAGANIDLDASAVILDSSLGPLDIVFYKQLTSKDGSIRHSGDEREGDESGDDEMISISLKNVQEEAKYIVFVITSYSEQELDDVAKAKCHLFDPKTKADIASYTLSNSKELDKHTALVMGCLYRDDGVWFLRIISQAAQGKVAHKVVPFIRKFLATRKAQPPAEVPELQGVDNQMPVATPVDDDIVVVSQEQMQHYRPS